MLKAGQEGDPSSPKALLWMTANCGLGGEVKAIVTAKVRSLLHVEREADDLRGGSGSGRNLYGISLRLGRGG
jgi:hypothetical protein